VGPLNITAGQTSTFVVNYVISPDAPQGPFNVVFDVTMTNVITSPAPLSVLASTVSFPTWPFPFLVERRDSAVIRGEALSGLKFRIERRAYRQAGA
jgi:hypothetical protein